MTCWEEIRRPHLNESPNPMGQLGMVITQHHWMEVFLEEVNGQGGRTLRVNVHVFMIKASHTVMWISAVVNINSLERDGLCQAELCPRNTMMMNTNNTLIPDRSQPGITMIAPTVRYRDVGDKYDTGVPKIKNIRGRKNISVEIWNVRTLRPAGKLEQLTHAMGRYH